MIKRKIPVLAKKWIAFLKKNPKKAKERLDEGGGRRCCLGHLCYLDSGLKRKKCHRGFMYTEKGADDGRTEKETELPGSTRRKVGIQSQGEFNKRGWGICEKFLKDNNISLVGPRNLAEQYYSLAYVNDFSDITHKQMGQLIELLYKGGGFLNEKD